MTITWLHVSDFHFRAGDPYDRDVVLRALVKSVERFRKEGRKPDLIFATGDVAYSSKPDEYQLATKFFDDLLKAAGLTKEYLFVVPGNHDVDRSRCTGLVRTLESREDADAYFGQGSLDHVTKAQAAFLEWHNEYFKKMPRRLISPQSTCGPVVQIEIKGMKLGILPINTALFCRDDNDHEKLWVGRRCLDPAIEKLAENKADITVALMHHPLEWLSKIERPNIKAKLQENVDFVLRGHVEEDEVETVVSAQGSVLHMQTGASYKTRKSPNQSLYCTIERNSAKVFPIRYEDKPKEIWVIDPSVFPDERDHEKSFEIPRPAAPAAQSDPIKTTPKGGNATPQRFRSNIPSRLDKPFVGRDELIEEIRKNLGDSGKERALVLHGHSGVGKSELAREFARLNRDKYPGGTFFVDFTAGAPPVDLATIGKIILGLRFPADLGLPDQCKEALLALGSSPSLIIYDNVPLVQSVTGWLPPAGMPCHVLITTIIDWCEPGWTCLPVELLTEGASLQLVEEIGGPDIAKKYGKEVAASGLPVQICPVAAMLAYEMRRGHVDSANLSLAGPTQESFRRAFVRLDGRSQLLLRCAAFLNPQRIPREELFRHVQGPTGWSKAEYQQLLDACLDLHLLEGTEELRMHQLFANFVLTALRDGEMEKTLKEVRRVQARRLVEIAEDLEDYPADTERAAAIMVFPLKPDAWADAEDEVSIDAGENIGRALIEIGRFDEALPWFERAVEAKEKGDLQGRVDNDSLGWSLHEVGYCSSSMGKYDEALPWHKRAVEAKEKGDVHGRVDNESLGRTLYEIGSCLSRMGRMEDALSWFQRAVMAAERAGVSGELASRSLHQVGFCLSEMGKPNEALPWYERALEATEKGDLHGQVDNESLGSSLHQMGYCLSSMGKYDEALPWFERAVGAAEKGDVHGRVNNESLGKSLGYVGLCLSNMGKYDEALPWHERAVGAAEKGDVHGRVDNESLSRSLHAVGDCLFEIDRYKEALPWYERAVEASEKGDVYGRVDSESLAVSLRGVAECLRKLGRNKEAKKWEKRATALDRDDDHSG